MSLLVGELGRGFVAAVVKRSGDREALALLDDSDAFDTLAAIAEEAESSAFVALDLQTVYAFGVESLTRGPTKLVRPTS